MDALNYLNDWDTLNKVGVSALAAYGLMTALSNPLKALTRLIDVLRSQQISWLLKQLIALRIRLLREPAQRARIAAAKRSPRGALNGAIGTATIYYLFSGLLLSLWILHMADAVMRVDGLPKWKWLGLVVTATVLFCPFAAHCKRLAYLERMEARRLWTQYQTKGLSKYVTLIATPMSLIALAIAIAALQLFGTS
ncbi:hypothetical protein J2W23_003802 [Variovorax boronicumulans]|uniref:hypothetical protein n=1 Tax=Variovorax boronicumulans TaxID=436515 RepID=UPI0027850DB3|nr:hypothetical protein [Variovorax boronicumulans]MDQ0015402.1 hypothetical protein [Variovorax boronicumulans]